MICPACGARISSLLAPASLRRRLATVCEVIRAQAERIAARRRAIRGLP